SALSRTGRQSVSGKQSRPNHCGTSDQEPRMTAPEQLPPPNHSVEASAKRTWDFATLAVLIAAVAVAAVTYGEWLPVSRNLWTSIGHDRQAHCYIGLRLAADAKQCQIIDVIKDLLFCSGVWGPLRGSLMALVLLIGGFDIRLAVLPDLAGFVGTAVLSFLIARRSVSRGSNLAGFTAALFVLASPAFHAFATDFMLESLGAC